MRSGIWRFAVAPSEKNRNKGAQLPSITCIQAPKTFWKIYFLYDFWCTLRINLFIPNHFWTTYTNFDNCCLRYIATCGKIVYVGAHLLSPP